MSGRFDHLGVLALALLLAGCPGSADTDTYDTGTDGGTATDPATDSSSATDPGTDSATEPPAARLQDVVTCTGGKMPASPPNSIGAPRGDGTDMHRLTLQDPIARCNDGSQAVIYVRPGTGPSASRWVLHLQGGGGCQGAADCAARWCGQGSYDRSKMSSDFAPETMGGKGIYSPAPENLLGNTTQVYFYYCSSDGWGGQVDDLVLTDPAVPSSTFAMYARGHSIVTAGIAALRPGGARSDDLVVTMPALDDASDVLFTGTSAGSVGVNRNLDWVADALAPVPVRGVLDASVLPLPEDFADPSLIPAPPTGAAFEALLAPFDMYLDASCVAAHQGTDALYQCGSAAHVALHHLTTPFFIRQDLGDPTASDTYVGLGYSLADYAAASHATLQRFAERSDAEEPSVVAPSVYAPGCGQHVGLTKDDWFLSTTLATAVGTPFTYQAAILGWLDGTTGVLADTVPPSRSVCAAPDQDKS